MLAVQSIDGRLTLDDRARMGPSDDKKKTTTDARQNDEERNPKRRKARGNRFQLALALVMNEKTSSGE